jgi:ligand-binding sensor domain-containing protein
MRNAITLHLAVLVALLGGCSSPPPARLRFEVVRSILEDSKGNFWFGSWKEGVCRFDGERLTYFTMEDGLSDNQIRSIREDRS